MRTSLNIFALLLAVSGFAAPVVALTGPARLTGRASLSAAPNDPDPVTSYFAAYSADSFNGTEEGDFVTSWPDYSGNGNHLTNNTSAQCPNIGVGTFGTYHPLAFRAGPDWLMRMTPSVSGHVPRITIVAVVKIATNATFADVVSQFGTSPTENQLLTYTAGNIAFAARTTVTVNTTAGDVSNAFHVITVVHADFTTGVGGTAMYEDGEEIMLVGAGTDNANINYISLGGDGGGLFGSKFDLLHYEVYNAILDETQIAAKSAWLRRRYGL